MSYIQCQKCGAYYGAIGNKFVPCACLPIMDKCGHNDQFGICPLERGHTGEHAKVPHRTYSAAELAQAEARGRLQEAIPWAERLAYLNAKLLNVEIADWAAKRLAYLRSLQPIPQAPQDEVVMCDHIDGVPCEPYVSYRRATQSPDLEVVAESIIAMLGSVYAQQGNTAHPGEKWSQMVLAELKAIAKQPTQQAPQSEVKE